MSGCGTRFVWKFDAAEEREVVEGALEHAVEAGFLALQEVQLRLGGEGGEAGGEAVESIAGGLGGDGPVEAAGLDGPGAAHAPVGGDHFLDEAVLDGVDGVEAGGELIVDEAEGLGAFAVEADASGEQTVGERV